MLKIKTSLALFLLWTIVTASGKRGVDLQGSTNTNGTRCWPCTFDSVSISCVCSCSASSDECCCCSLEREFHTGAWMCGCLGPRRCPTPSPTPVSTPSPTPAPDPSAGGGCFSGESTLQVLKQGSVKMQDLQVGDLVLTGSPGHFMHQPVYAFGHVNKQALLDFYAITTKGNTVPLEMTGEHLVYLANKENPVRADSLQVGDVLFSIHGPTEITAIYMVRKRGLYNPLVADGNLVVNGIAVSTYIALQKKNPEHYQVNFGGGYEINLVSHQNFVHIYLTPFRMLCMGVSSQLCQIYDEEGSPYYISLGMKLVHWVGAQNVIVQLIFLLITMPVYVAFLAVEMMVGASAAPLVVFAMVLLAKKAQTLTLKRQKVA